MEIHNKIEQQIIDRLKEVELKHGIKILFAVESGSRAWGFESKDSDYDIRCVHIKTNPDDYLSMNDVESQITIIDENIDIVSWDIRKFFKLMIKSNPSISEWLRSDIVYINKSKDNMQFIQRFRGIFDEACSLTKLQEHYISMAKQNYHKYINKNNQIELKKYVYVLRALGCYQYISNTGIIPPMRYDQSYAFLPLFVIKFFNECVDMKRNGESIKGERNERVDRWIENVLNEKLIKDNTSFFDEDMLNWLMINIIKEGVE